MTDHCGPKYNSVLKVAFSEESATEPVTVDEVKDWCRIDVSDDDTLIGKLIKGARVICENYANLSFIKRTITAKIRNGLGDFYPPYGPVVGDPAATYKSGDTIDDFDFDCSYPDTITVVYDAGYDAADGYETLPDNLRTALLNQVLFMYENRGDAKLANGLSEEAKLILKQVRYV